MIYVIATDAVVVTSPKPLNFGSVVACSFLIGSTAHKQRSFTSMDWIKSVVRVLAIGKPAVTAINLLRKGSVCAVQGTLMMKEWLSPEGIKYPLVGVTADRILLSRVADAADIITVSPFIQSMIDAWTKSEESNGAMLSNDTGQDDWPLPAKSG